MNQHRPAPRLRRDRLHPAGARQLHQRDRLQHGLRALAEERHVRHGARATPRAPHPLQEGRHRARRISLEHRVEIAHVDPELQRRRAGDTHIRSMVERGLGGLALLQRHGAVVNEHLGSARAQVPCDGLRQGAALAEEQALLVGRERDGLAGEIQHRGAAENGNLPLRRRLRRIDDHAFPARAAREPRQDRRGIPHGRAQADALHVVLGLAHEALDDAEQVGSAIGPGERVDLVDDHEAQIREEAARAHLRRDQHHLEGLRRRHQQLGRLAREALAIGVLHVAVPDEAP